MLKVQNMVARKIIVVFCLSIIGPLWAQTDETNTFSTKGLLADLDNVLSDQAVIIASGPAGSMNYINAGLICETISRALLNDAPRCFVQPTTGSTSNLQLLINGEADMALIQSDREYFAAKALGPYREQKRATNIRRIAAIAGMPIHVVVKAQSGINLLEDFSEARVGLGEEGSAQRLISRVILSTAGVRENTLSFINANPLSRQVASFCANQLDAVILTTTAPSPLVSEMLRRCDGKLISLSSTNINALTDENNYLVPLELAANTYSNQPENIFSLGYVVSLIGYKGRRTPLIHTIASELPQVYSSLGERFDGIGLVPEDKLFDLGQSAPLHLGVETFLQTSVKEISPQDDNNEEAKQ